MLGLTRNEQYFHSCITTNEKDTIYAQCRNLHSSIVHTYQCLDTEAIFVLHEFPQTETCVYLCVKCIPAMQEHASAIKFDRDISIIIAYQ